MDIIAQKAEFRSRCGACLEESIRKGEDPAALAVGCGSLQGFKLVTDKLGWDGPVSKKGMAGVGFGTTDPGAPLASTSTVRACRWQRGFYVRHCGARARRENHHEASRRRFACTARPGAIAPSIRRSRHLTAPRGRAFNHRHGQGGRTGGRRRRRQIPSWPVFFNGRGRHHFERRRSDRGRQENHLAN
jgi:hypothetical protein